MNFDEKTKASLLTYPIENILSACGKDVTHSKTGHYFSPFRSERTPSFFINKQKNTWTDFGSGVGGGVLKLLEMLMGLDKAAAFDWLSQQNPNAIVYTPPTLPSGKRTTEHPVKVLYDESITQGALLEYIQKRGLMMEYVNPYCRQLYYEIAGKGRRFGIGFPNNNDGWVIRSEHMKICTDSFFTTIDINGRFNGSLTCNSVVVFEGFMNFLSYMQYNHRAVPISDVCVLNSTVNARRAMGYLAAHSLINCATDNDATGTKCLEEIRSGCPNSQVIDRRGLYEGYNDFNDFIQGKKKNN